MIKKYFQLFVFILEYLYERFIRLINGDLKIEEGGNSIENKVAIVTGANTGLGKVIALRLAERGAKVVLACRNISQGRLAVDEIRSVTGCSSKNLVRYFLNSSAFDHCIYSSLFAIVSCVTDPKRIGLGGFVFRSKVCLQCEGRVSGNQFAR